MRRLAPMLLLLLAAADPAAQLQRALAGKVERPPVQCVPLRSIDQTTVIDENTILYRQSAHRLYLNHPRGGCLDLTPFRVLVTRTSSSNLCAGDIASVVDLQTHTAYGSCAMGPFIPYETPKP